MALREQRKALRAGAILALCTWIAGCGANAILGSRDAATGDSNTMTGDAGDANTGGDGAVDARDGNVADENVTDDGTGDANDGAPTDDGTGDASDGAPTDDGTGDAGDGAPTDDGTGDASETTPADDGMGDTAPDMGPGDDGVVPDVQPMDAMDVVTPMDDGIVPDVVADAAPEAGPDNGCSADQMLCGSTCTNVTTDPTNCGMCGRSCGTGQVCAMGACACATGTTMCGTACVATTSDTANCGMCGNACVAGQSCNMGMCQCPMGQTLCGGACVDTTSSNANCGTCGTACPAGQVCNGGMCRATCDLPRMTCGTGTSAVCTDTQSDENNCGTCGNRCPVGPGAILGNCLAGTCIAICAPNRGNCDRNLVNGCEVDTNIDANNCGACGIQCTGGQVCLNGTCGCPTGFIMCGGVCRNQATDNSNCGTCNNACGTGNGQTCIGGTCTCTGAGQIACGLQCFNGQTDNMHCGNCTTVCGGGQTCVAGTCQCPAGQTFCAGACVDTATSNAHCGGCNMACTGGVAPNNRTCQGRMCLCPAGQNYCMAQDRCRNFLTDPLNCGGCGNICPGQPGGAPSPGGAQLCTNGTCGLTCGMGQMLCGSGAGMYCANTQTDNTNCGACNNNCNTATTGRTCQSGTCQCPAGQTLCGTVCRTLTSDVNNCGACNTMCPAPGTMNIATSVCTTPPAAGGCAIACNAGSGNCNNNVTDGCETNTNTSTSHCGMCGNACATGQICSNGTCRNAVGCADGVREGFTNGNMYPDIAACSGAFLVPGLHPATTATCGRAAGNTGTNTTGTGCSAQDLCATGWHVCRNAGDVTAHTPGGSGCNAIGSLPANTLFATGQSSTGCDVCATGTQTGAACTSANCAGNCANTAATTNDFYGCGNLGTDLSRSAACSPLTRASGDNCGNVSAGGWSCASPGGLTESITVTHSTSVGGVLCCRD